MVLNAYKRKQSPFGWIQYGITAAERQTIRTATRKNDPTKKRKVVVELHRIEARLLPLIGNGNTPHGNWR